MIWSEYGISGFPLKLPMVGQEEFYDDFKSFAKNKMKTAGMATVYPVIANWGVGKTRIGFEMISQVLGIDKGWIICEHDRQEKVRVFDDKFEDNVLPIYIRYTHMAHEDLMGDTWIGYGTYIALSFLALEPESTIQGAVIRELHNALEPRGFDKQELHTILEIETIDKDALVDPGNRDRDRLIQSAMDYLEKFDIHHLLIICDEVETATEIARYGIEDHEERITRLDSEAIKVLTEGIKHEDARKKHPFITFMLLCSPQIGNSITGLGALDRRIDKSEISQNSFADISFFIDHLKKMNLVSQYPEGFIQAAYATAGGNFGWFNVIMADAENYLNNVKQDTDTREIFEYLLKTSNRFRDNLIDKAAFDFIQCNEKDKHLIRGALLKQLPAAKSTYKDETEQQILLDARAEDGEKLFKEFYCLKLKVDELGKSLDEDGYKRQSGYKFANEIGSVFDLYIMLKSLKTFSLNKKENEYIVGSDKETFLDQVRMLYPEEGAEEASEYIYRYILKKVTTEAINADYIGPNFAYLRKLNKRYKIEKGDFGYLKDNEANKILEKYIEAMRKEPGESQRIISGFARLLEIGYPRETPFTIDNIPCLETKVESGPYLDLHPKNKVTIIWGKDEEKLEHALKNSRLLADGVHAVFVVSDNAFPEDLKEKITGNNPAIGKCLIFITVLTTKKEILEVVSLDKNKIDIRSAQHRLTPTFSNKINSIKDYITSEVKKWFDKNDSEGWILRPIIYKSNYDENQIAVMAEAFSRMLIMDATYEDLGVHPDNKLKDEDFEELKSILERYIYIGKTNENKGYRETGLFLREGESYSLDIPPPLERILRYIGNSRKNQHELLISFFYSCTEKVNHKKTLEQWLLFITRLDLLGKKEGFIERITSYHLNALYDEVKSWFEKDYKEELKKMESLIKGGYLDILIKQEIGYKVKLEEADNLKNNTKLDALTKNRGVFENWKKQLSNLREFYRLCFYIYDREQYNAVTSYNRNLIRKLKIDDEDVPLWKRVRNIRLFLDEIKEFKDPAARKVNEKIAEIKNSCIYRGHQLPPSPITNILKRYKSELEYATDYDTLTTKPTIGHPSDTLAYKLICGKYGEAKARLDSILEKCGLEGIDTSTLKWNEEEGVIGNYNRIFKAFAKIVDFYLDEMKYAHHWRDYFFDAEEITTFIDKEVLALKDETYILSTFMEDGLRQEIDDQEEVLQSEPFEFLNCLDKLVKENNNRIGVIQGISETVKNKAKEERNKRYDETLIKSIDKLRKLQDKPPASLDIDRESIPGEKSFKETVNKIKRFHKMLEKEGEEFFEQSPTAAKTTFRFFKKVVEKDGDINWSEYNEEKEELEAMELIRTKVEVL